MSNNYRQKLMDFWNDHITDIFKNLPPNESSKNEERPEILPPETYPRLPFFPFHPERNPQIITWRNGLPVFSSTPTPHVYGTIVKTENEKPRSASTGLLAVDRGFGSKFQLTSTPEVTEVIPEVEAGNSSSMAMSIVIVVGVCFLLVNFCAFAGLYYQRDRLKVQEMLMKKRYEDVENTNNEDCYTRKLHDDKSDGEDYLEKTNRKEMKKKKQHSGEELYEAVRSRGKTLDGHEDVIEEEEEIRGEADFKKWKLSRQCSASTMDPHTKVREWIAHEIVQRCSPRFLRKPKSQNPTARPVLQHDDSLDTFIEHNSSIMAPAESKINTPSSPALSKPTTTLQRSKVKKVSVAVDATPSARGSSVLKQIPVEQMSKSMEELGLGKCVSSTEITLQQKRATLKRSETCRESLARSSSSSSDPNNRDTVLRRSTSISLQLYQPASKGQNTNLNISHQHSKSDPVPHSANQNPSCNIHNVKFTNVTLDASKMPHDPYSKGIQLNQMKSFKSGPNSKSKIAKEVPTPNAPDSNVSKDVNVTSRDSFDKKDNMTPTDPLKTIQRRNFPKVLPDLPPNQDASNCGSNLCKELTHAQNMAAKRRSLPPPLYLSVSNEDSTSEAATTSQPTTPTNAYHKGITMYPQVGKVPPPPPPRISSTLGRKPNNTAPVTSSFDSQDSVNASPIYQQRPEPRFVIKPTSTAPVTRNPALIPQGRSKAIPRVVPSSGEEYPLTPTAVHHQYYQTSNQNEATDPIAPLQRQNSLRNPAPHKSALQTPSKYAPDSHVQIGVSSSSLSSKGNKLEPQLQSQQKLTRETLSHELRENCPTKSGRQNETRTTSTAQKAEVSTKILQGKSPQQKSAPKGSTEPSAANEETSSNTGTVRRVKKVNESKKQDSGNPSVASTSSPTKSSPMSKSWYAQYNQSFLSKSKDSDN